MEDWYDKGEGSEHMKRQIAKSARDNPVKFPCLDPEGCKHFKAEDKLRAQNAKLKADLEYYGNHDGDCDIAAWAGGKCDCGYEKALKDNGCKAETETV